jgi:hypothetical protein
VRSLILLLCLLLTAITGHCQQEFLSVSADTTEDMNEGDSAYVMLHSRGVTAFEQRNYSKAERIFKKAMTAQPSEEDARYCYYALLYQGLDMEAADFKWRYAAYCFAIPEQKRGLESIYLDAGPRFSANHNAGDILYGDAGAVARLTRRLRLWSSLTYLQQDEDLGHYRQYEFFAALFMHAGKGWYVRPSFHYAYVPYTSIIQDSGSVSYTQSYPVGHDDTLVYKTKAVQTVTTTSPGFTNCYNAALTVSKRMGSLGVDVESGYHIFTGRSAIRIAYSAAGTTDSFRRNRFEGSKPFYDSGNSSRDTSYRTSYSQLGIGISYRLPLRGEPVTLRAAAYGLWAESGAYGMAYHASCVFWWRTRLRIYLSWLRKDVMPLALHSEGMYFNFTDPIRNRTSMSFQLFPLRRFSPGITYQYEKDIRLSDNADLVYHSVYLTLKYNP